MISNHTRNWDAIAISNENYSGQSTSRSIQYKQWIYCNICGQFCVVYTNKLLQCAATLDPSCASENGLYPKLLTSVWRGCVLRKFCADGSRLLGYYCGVGCCNIFDCDCERSCIGWKTMHYCLWQCQFRTSEEACQNIRTICSLGGKSDIGNGTMGLKSFWILNQARFAQLLAGRSYATALYNDGRCQNMRVKAISCLPWFRSCVLTCATAKIGCLWICKIFCGVIAVSSSIALFTTSFWQI